MANGLQSVAVGGGAKAGGNIPALGVVNEGSTAIGGDAQAGATASGQTHATAVGFKAQANAASATAMGDSAVALGHDTIAIGTSAGLGSAATNSNNVAV